MVQIAAPALRDWDYPRGIASIALLVDFGRELGVPRSTMLRDAHISESALMNPATQVDAHQELAVIRNLVRASADRPGIGLDVGIRYRVTTFGIFGFACISSPTLRDAIELALRYLDLSFTFCIPIVDVSATEIRMTLDSTRVPSDVRQFLIERDLTAIFTVIGDILSAPLQLTGLELDVSEPSYAARFEQIMGIRPVFGMPTNTAAFSPEYLDRPLPQANQHTVALCEAQCRVLVAARRERVGFAHEVRERLTRIGGALDMDTVAGEMGMSTRSLRRRLADAGTSFRALREEVLETLAVEMLETGALSVEDVAVRLGYAEASSFIYAFKQWTGTTPFTYKRRQYH